MNNLEKYLIDAMVCGCKGIDTPPPSEKIDMEPFFKKAKEHKIENIVYKAVKDNLDYFDNSEKIMPLWNQITVISSVSLIRLGAIVKAVTSRLEEEKLSVILLKGSVIKDLYPKAELRTMGDTDIIIKEEEFSRVLKVFEEFGYINIPDVHSNPQFVKENNYKFEAFFTLTTIDNLWEKVDNIEGKNFVFKLKNEMFLYHLIAHLAKHLKYKGAGIRNLCDIYLVMEKWDIDYDVLLSMLHERGLTSLFYAIVKILRLYFGFESDKIKEDCEKSKADKLLEFMIRYGVYGTQSENNVFLENQLDEESTRKKRFLKKLQVLFPTSEGFLNQYSYAKKCSLLLPVAWIHRIWQKRFKEKRKIGATLIEMNKSGKIMESQTDIIKEFNL